MLTFVPGEFHWLVPAMQAYYYSNWNILKRDNYSDDSIEKRTMVV